MTHIVSNTLWVIMILSAMIAVMSYMKTKTVELKKDIVNCNESIKYMAAKITFYDMVYNKVRFNNPASPFILYNNDINILNNEFGEEIINDIINNYEGLLIIQKGIKKNVNDNYL